MATLSLANDAYSDGTISSLVDAADDLEINIIKSQTYPQDATDDQLATVLSLIKDSGARVIVLVGYSSDASNVLRVALAESWA